MRMNEMLKVGFVGCGTHSTNNLYPMLKYSRCRLVAVCDADENLARRNAGVFGAGDAFYTDADRMLDDCELDGVFVVGPAAMHYEVGRKVLARGIPLFAEKPPAPTLSQAEELVSLAREHDTIFMVGFMKRHGLTYKKAREMMTDGSFEPAAGFFKYGHWPMTDLNNMLLGMCSHPIDLAISFFGDVAEVSSTLSRDARNSISLAVTLRFQSGKWAQLMLDASQPRIQERVEISGVCNGGNALLVVDNVDHMEFHRQGQRGIDVLVPLPDINPQFDLADIQMWRPDYGIPNMGQTRHFIQGFAGEVREFADAILEKREPYPSGAESLKTMRVIAEILQQQTIETK